MSGAANSPNPEEDDDDDDEVLLFVQSSSGSMSLLASVTLA